MATVAVCVPCAGCVSNGGCAEFTFYGSCHHGSLPYFTVLTTDWVAGPIECIACGETVVGGYLAELPALF